MWRHCSIAASRSWQLCSTASDRSPSGWTFPPAANRFVRGHHRGLSPVPHNHIRASDN